MPRPSDPLRADAAAQLLDSDLPAGYLSEWARHFALAKSSADRKTMSVFIFRLGAEWLALPTGSVREAAPLRPIHSLPHRGNGTILGLVNVRGELLICISLIGLLALGKNPATEEKTGRLIVIGDSGGRVAFPVDEAHGIHACHSVDVKETPVTVAKAATPCSRGIFSWRDRTVGLLEEKTFFAALNRSLA